MSAPKQLTPQQITVEYFKKAKGYDGDPGWDELYFVRAVTAAAALVKFLGSKELACQAIDELGAGFDAKGLTWTLETIVKHAAEWKGSTHRPKRRGPGVREEDAPQYQPYASTLPAWEQCAPPPPEFQALMKRLKPG